MDEELIDIQAMRNKASDLTDKRLTEATLRDAGTYGNKMQVVYDLLVKNTGDNGYHTRSVVDEFLIPCAETKNTASASSAISSAVTSNK